MSDTRLPLPIVAREDVPEGWVFIDRGDGTLVPVLAMDETLHIDGCSLPGDHEGPCDA